MRLGFAGSGNMAAALARGWAAGEGGPETMMFCDLDAERARTLAAEVRGETRGSLPELVRDVDVIVLAVKPGALDDVARELEGEASALISVLAATTTGSVAEAFPGVPALRVMPNQPVEVRRGVLCYPPPVQMPDDLLAALLELLGLLGTLVPLEERLIDPAMAVMSSSPAYIALVAEALARAGEREGLEPRVCGELVARALAGTAELLLKKDPAAIRAAVASPGGATEAGLSQLEGVVENAFASAVTASLERFR
ncbi:MAG TPA: pyrroline-5-carboxylate reductase dimerization domain-containing protein [Solirubrobacterales bacterium]|nr:pyrroline-5-carboxylate reductase dimerization domain-containing protein [Solirubrobacterales bacterium]